MCACVEQKREKKPSRALNVSNARSLNYDVNATAADNDIDLKMYSAQKKSSAQSLRRSRGNFDIQQKGEVRGRRRARIAGGYVGARERALGFRRFVARKRRNLQHEKGLLQTTRSTTNENYDLPGIFVDARGLFRVRISNNSPLPESTECYAPLVRVYKRPQQASPRLRTAIPSANARVSSSNHLGVNYSLCQ